MTALNHNTDHPTPDAAHLHSEIGYASLPPPPSLEVVATADRFPSPRDGAPLVERFAPHWIDLLRQAVEEPGLISEAYTRFHGYSLGNRFAALIQCRMRSIEPGPLNTFNGWRKLGYGVCEGEKALTLCMPLKGVLAREKQAAPDQAARSNSAAVSTPTRPDIEEIEYIRAFVWKPHWFVLSQTQPFDSDNVQPLSAPMHNEWSAEAALATLHIHLVPFSALDGNVQGMAQGRGIAVSPLAEFPQKTFFHEMAHVVLGHTEPACKEAGNAQAGDASTVEASPLLEDGATLSRSEREAEAEGVALLLLDTLGLPGQEHARGYIQHWLRGDELTEKSAQRIFGTADRILSAGLGEGRMRHPTAEELGWPENGAMLFGGRDGNGWNGSDWDGNGWDGEANGISQINGASQSSSTPASVVAIPPRAATSRAEASPAAKALETTPETAPLATMVFNGSHRATMPQNGNGNGQGHDQGKEAALPSFARQGATVPVSASLNETTDSGAAYAWKLHGRLTLLHDELHPEAPEESAGIARGLRHLASLDPLGALALRDLVKSASRDLKAACRYLEATLESEAKLSGDEGNDGVDVFSDEEAPSAEASSETPNGAGQNGGADLNGLSGIAANPATQVESAALSANALPARRAESARRSIGRQLRDELGAEKRRFLEAAKEHGLKVGGRHEKAMLGALSEFLGCAVVSRRTPSLHQWMQAASALETEDLRW